MRSNFRKEIKFLIHQSTFESIKDELACYLTLDVHGDALGYYVKSIYFDSLENSDLMDALSGSFIKEKIRLRSYGEHGDKFQLELKQKNGDDVVKRSVTLTRDEAISVSNCDFSVLLRKEDPFGVALYAKLKSGVYRPKLVIGYNRLAYVHPFNRTRITFDTRVTTGFQSDSFFDGKIHGLNHLEPYMGILEVKYDDFLLEPIKKCLSRIDSSQIANSKYVNGHIKYAF